MIYEILFKGLRPNTDVFEPYLIYIQVLPHEDVDALVQEYIYAVRNKEKFYKIKYISKVLIREYVSASY